MERNRQINKRVDVVMKERFQFYKNIILVVASALTLVAVTFAWFSTPFASNVPSFKAEVDSELINVQFYESLNNGTTYQKMDSSTDISVSGVAGTFEKYKFIVKTTSAEKMNLTMCIDDLPSEMNADLKDAVCIKYEMYTATKDSSGNITQGSLITSSTGTDGYVSLSDITSGVIFNDYSIADYQQTKNDYFVIYYEIGISENASTSIQGLSSDLGSIRLSAQLQG